MKLEAIIQAERVSECHQREIKDNEAVYIYNYLKKQSHYRPGVAQRVPGS